MTIFNLVRGQADMLLSTGSFSEQLVHVTGSIFFLTVNTACMRSSVKMEALCKLLMIQDYNKEIIQCSNTV